MQEMFRRGRLPHWDVPGATYFITTCLEGSIPAQGLLDISQYRDELARCPRPDKMSERAWKHHCWKKAFARAEEWLDVHPAARHLEDKSLAEIVANTFYYFAGTRYDMLAYVVMPSHAHWVFAPRRSYEETLPKDTSARQAIMHSIKRYSAHKCNEKLGQRGTFWQRESFDHCVLDEDELERIVDYVELNPVKAGLAGSRELWRFSSAYDRKKWGLPMGQALVKPE